MRSFPLFLLVACHSEYVLHGNHSVSLYHEPVDTTTSSFFDSGSLLCYALEFDGIDDYVLLANYRNFFNIARDFTLAAKVKIYNVNPQYDQIFSGEMSTSDDSEKNAGYGLRIQGLDDFTPGAITGHFGTGHGGSGAYGTYGTQPINNNVWTSVIFTRNGSLTSLFLDGRFNLSYETKSNADISYEAYDYETDKYELGRYERGDGLIEAYIHGVISDVMIWNRGFSNVEVWEFSYSGVIPSGLVGYYPADEGSGNFINEVITGTQGEIFGARWINDDLDGNNLCDRDEI